jgi:hypothetical protein
MAAIRGRRKVFVAPFNFLEAVELDVSIAIPLPVILRHTLIRRGTLI